MTTARAISVAVLALAVAMARPAAAEGPLALRHAVLQRTLPLGLRMEVAPGVLVIRGGNHGASMVGVTGMVTVKSYADLVIVNTEVESFDDGAGTSTRWSVDVHLGGELAPAELVGHLVGCARSLARRVW